nr:glycosyltransferase family 9 protein [candidate division Zixibacteria bacterium]NIR66150.1 glycosyltransferase family 9 protein [candidate division Zixibacteria bacterium]NIS17234.1 glycosyltransferase family 9 protein [candidate division Zixibacteria bacterium]NIS47773.1 glycosyltransferase family 9 protein [candidate division Zixibacteria bacterium]NIT53591.1 glycosyltransferase family 9 protein [candidate division Zixibacteria bacterium]
FRGLLDGLSEYGIKYRYKRPKIYLAKSSLRESNLWLLDEGLETSESFIVSVNAGSGFRYKRWSVDRYIRLCKWMIAEFDAHIVVVSRSRKDSTARALFRRLPKEYTHWLVNKPLDLVAGVLSKTDINIGNDSGIAHLASAVGVPTVTIFGPTSPAYWKPAGSNSIVVYNMEKTCRCGYKKAERCTNKVCFDSINETHFADAILYSLNLFVGRWKKPSLDRIKIAPNVKIEQNGNGTIIYNRAVPKPILINHGLKKIKQILNYFGKTRSYIETVNKYPEYKEIADFFLMHRILISDSPKIYNRDL